MGAFSGQVVALEAAKKLALHGKRVLSSCLGGGCVWRQIQRDPAIHFRGPASSLGWKILVLVCIWVPQFAAAHSDLALGGSYACLGHSAGRRLARLAHSLERGLAEQHSDRATVGVWSRSSDRNLREAVLDHQGGQARPVLADIEVKTHLELTRRHRFVQKNHPARRRDDQVLRLLASSPRCTTEPDQVLAAEQLAREAQACLLGARPAKGTQPTVELQVGPPVSVALGLGRGNGEGGRRGRSRRERDSRGAPSFQVFAGRLARSQL